MKGNYENRNRYFLTRRMPVIIRIDGKAFHTLTKKWKCQKPFDEKLNIAMTETTAFLLKEFQGAKIAYHQSDEISLLLTDYDKLTTDGWFDYNIQKICSVGASTATACFNARHEEGRRNPAIFDCRCFNIPREEVTNYFIWRQKDWIRNSASMLAQSEFSHKELEGKSQADMHEMLYWRGINWADLAPVWKNGSLMELTKMHFLDITQNRDIIENHVYCDIAALKLRGER